MRAQPEACVQSVLNVAGGSLIGVDEQMVRVAA